MELLIYTSKAATILSIFYLVYFSALRKETLFTANRHYFLSGILTATILPFIEITKTIIVEIPAAKEITYTQFLPIEQMPIQEALSINWWQVAFFIYLIGVSFMSLRFVKQIVSLGLLLFKYPSVKKDGYRYIIISENTAPFSFFKNIVYNPDLHTQQELEMILKHEEVHATQWHSIDIIATNLLVILQWINPLAWIYKKAVEENLEYIADSATVQQIESVKQYQLALVKASSTSPIPALTNNFYQSFIKKRIVMLNKSTSKKINAWKLMLVLPLLAVFLLSFNINEVVIYTDSDEPDSEFTNPSSASEGIGLTSEKKLFNDSEETSVIINSEVIPEYETNLVKNETSVIKGKNSATNSVLARDGVITITKNTTKKELDAMKTDLKSNGVSFDYSNLVYNKSKEITGISFNYQSKNGNAGSHSMSSDTPIDTIIIDTIEDRASVSSKASTSYSYSSDENAEVMRGRTQEQQKRLERQRAEMEIRKVEMKERQNEMQVRQVEMKVRQVEMLERQIEIHERQREMNEHRTMLILEVDSSNVHGAHIYGDSDGAVYEIQDTHSGSGDVLITDRIGDNGDHHLERHYNYNFSSDLKRITKNSSKNDLEKLKLDFDSKGISFSYGGVKRNDAGEITKIKLKIKDNNGSSSSSSYDGEGQTIDNILIDTNNGITIIKGSSH
ncbi:MAG: hypothetical protein ACJA1Z_001943 [Patiriisocius sp.]|jgi:bla regulator protein BlaR1